MANSNLKSIKSHLDLLTELQLILETPSYPSPRPYKGHQYKKNLFFWSTTTLDYISQPFLSKWNLKIIGKLGTRN